MKDWYIVPAPKGGRLFYELGDAIEYAEDNGKDSIGIFFDWTAYYQRCKNCGGWVMVRNIKEGYLCPDCRE